MAVPFPAAGLPSRNGLSAFPMRLAWGGGGVLAVQKVHRWSCPIIGRAKMRKGYFGAVVAIDCDAGLVRRGGMIPAYNH